MFDNRSHARANVLSLDAIAKIAPSVFAEAPYHAMSDRYRFVPTIRVIERMMQEGFVPVAARQGATRIEGKASFTKHQIRFRHSDMQKRLDLFMSRDDRSLADAPEIAELVLTNSHDGTSRYLLDLGLFRAACANGLFVQSGSLQGVGARHSGKSDLVGEVIDASFKVIEEAPKALAQVEDWKTIKLSDEEQVAFAASALEIRDTALDISPSRILHSRRSEDTTELNGSRDLYKTFNVVQEHLTKGGVSGRTETNRRSRLRSITSIDGDTKLNKALWTLAERMAEIKTGRKLAVA